MIKLFIRGSFSAEEEQTRTIAMHTNKVVISRKINLSPVQVVEESLAALETLIESFDSSLYQSPNHMDEAKRWRKEAENCPWVSGIRQLVMVATKVIRQLKLGHSVVLSNDDGRGAIARIVSLVEVCGSSN